METKTQKLIKSLNIVINALKNNTIRYEWTQQASCNCGIVAQAVLGKTAEQISGMFDEVVNGLKKYGTKEKRIDPTWQNGVKFLCPLTGEPMVDVYKKLFEAGLSKSDIVHLEYMNNPAILKRSGISAKVTEVVTKKELVSRETVMEKRKHPNWIYRLFGGTVDVPVTKDIYKEVDSEELVDDTLYHTRKKNLIKYLSAWVLILQEGAKYKEAELDTLTADELESELIVAVANDNFEYAAVLRDKINLK